MTVSEMHLALRLTLDKSTSLAGAVDFLPEEFDYWLNEAQDRFIKQRVYGNNDTGKKLGDDSKRISDLSKIIFTSTLTFTTSNISQDVIGNAYISRQYVLIDGNGTNVVKANEASTIHRYSYFISALATQVTTGSLTNSIPCVFAIDPFALDAYRANDMLSNPYIRRPLIFESNIEGNRALELIYDNQNSFDYLIVTFVGKPLKLVNSNPVVGVSTITCELNEHTHIEIVNIAAGLLLENIESSRTQTFPLNSSKIE